MSTLLIVEDDPATRTLLTKVLTKWNHRPIWASNLRDARAILNKENEIDLLLLDRGLPDGDGIKLCLQLKKDHQKRLIPIIVLTAQNDFSEEIETYKNGADLFLSKPVDVTKLKGYVNGLLSRIPFQDEKPSLLQCGPLKMNLKTKKAIWKDRELPELPALLFNLLQELAFNNGKFVSRQMILWKLWKNRVRDKEVDVAVSRLRKKLGPDFSELILSAHGKGYAISTDRRPNSIPKR